MTIVMFTNTYLPHVGGVARSVNAYEEEFRRRGHDVRVVAPQFEGALDSTAHVLRTSALQHFNGSDFSFTLPQPGLIADFLNGLNPRLLHSHHPFLLGDSALRAAWTRRLPLVFTHHTLYEQYTHYLPLDSEALQRVAIQLATEYANLCTHVIAPSHSLAELLVQRRVTTPISVIPTGIDLACFAGGNGRAFREKVHIPQDALVVGHVGRLAGEKNLDYLARATGRFLAEHADSVLLVIGSGEHEEAVKEAVSEIANAERIIMPGTQTGQALADAYAAMDVFVFSSQSETQGMVLAEAMAAATPVVALDGPGVRDVLNDTNGLLLPADAPEEAFASALTELTRDRDALRRLGESARESIREFGLSACANRMLDLYSSLIGQSPPREPGDPNLWNRFVRRVEIEWNLLVKKTTAISAAVVETDVVKGQLN